MVIRLVLRFVDWCFRGNKLQVLGKLVAVVWGLSLTVDYIFGTSYTGLLVILAVVSPVIMLKFGPVLLNLLNRMGIINLTEGQEFVRKVVGLLFGGIEKIESLLDILFR